MMHNSATTLDPLSPEEMNKTSKHSNASKPVPIVPVPDDAPPMEFEHPKHGKPTKFWAYHDVENRLIGYMCRWDFTDAEDKPDKLIRPVMFCDCGNGHRAWRSAGMPIPRPLYNLPEIAQRPEVWIMVTEGEKACEAAQALFPNMVCTTPPHGAQSPHKAEWSIVKCRTLAISPDADKAGVDYRDKVADLARKHGAERVLVLPPERLAHYIIKDGKPVPREGEIPVGWDLADALADGWTAEHVAELSDAPDLFEEYQFDDDETNTDSTVTAPPGYIMRPDGLFWRDSSDSDKPDLHVSGPFEVLAETRSATSDNWGVLLRWVDHDDREHTHPLPRSALAGDGAEARRVLMDQGLYIAPGRKPRELFTAYLASVRTDDRAKAVKRIGWHDNAFVLPDGTIGDANDEHIILQTGGSSEHAFKERGTLADWQQNVAQLAIGNSRLVLSLSAAFAAPLLHLVGAESGGLHLRGPSSTGKSTALVVAGSVWGGGGLRGYVGQWRATDNGLEAVAQKHSDSLLCLDEMSQIDAKSAGNSAYMLANGAGKVRANRNGDGRTPAEWRVLFLSNGEIGLAEKLAEEGKGRKATAGQEVRVVDIPADAEAGMGLFEDIHGLKDADTFARHIKTAATENYGVAIRPFISEVISDADNICTAIKGYQNDFIAEHCPPGTDGQVTRVAARFSLIAAAGELATTWQIVPWERNEAIDAAGKCFHAWLGARGGVEPAEVTAGIAQVRKFIEQHGESRFTPWDETGATSDRLTINRAGFRKRADFGGMEYYVLPQVWRTEVCAGFDPTFLGRALAERGMLKTRNAGKKLQFSARLPGFGKSVSCYLLTPALLEEPDDA